MRHSSESFDRSVQLKHCYHDSHHNWIFFFFIFFHLQSCLLLLWDFSEWHQHKDLCYFNTVCKSLQAKELFGGSDSEGENWVWSLSQKDPLEKEMAAHSCLENPMDGGAWQAEGQRVAKSWTWLSDSPVLFLGEWKSFTICTGRVRNHLL